MKTLLLAWDQAQRNHELDLSDFHAQLARPITVRQPASTGCDCKHEKGHADDWSGRVRARPVC